MNPIVNEKIVEKKTLEKLHNFAIKLTHNKEKAQELVSDTILKVLEKQDLYRYDVYFTTWCTNIMKNLFIDGCRKSTKTDFIEFLGDVEDVQGEENIALWKLSVEDIYDCINQLKETEKQLILRRIEDKMSFKELGLIYKIGPNSIRFRYYLVVKKLREIIVERNKELATLNRHLKRKKRPQQE